MYNTVTVVVVLTIVIALLVARWQHTPTLRLVHQFNVPLSDSEQSLGMPAVVGVTSLLGYIYVLRAPTNDVILYNATSFELITAFYVSGLVSAADMTSISHHREIYIADSRRNSVFCLRELRFVHTDGQQQLKAATWSWSVGCSPTGLSVSAESNIVVACLGTRDIKQFTRYGHTVSSYRITGAHPFHAISLSDREIVVGYSDNYVCALYVPGKRHSIRRIEMPERPHVIVLFGASVTSSTPVTYDVDCNIPAAPRNVIVVDRYLLYNDNMKHRLQMLDLSNLAKVGYMRRPESPYHRITRLWYDEQMRRIFASDVYGTINVYHVSSTGT